MTAQDNHPEGFSEAGVEDVKRLLDEGYQVVDVREQWEWDRGHIPGAKHVVLGSILADPAGQKFSDRAVFQCQVGEGPAGATEMRVAGGGRPFRPRLVGSWPVKAEPLFKRGVVRTAMPRFFVT